MLLQSSEREELNASQAFVERLLEDSIAKLEEEEPKRDNFMRWELGACWIQHLQDQKNAEKDKKPSHEKAKNEMKVEGLGTPLRVNLSEKLSHVQSLCIHEIIVRAFKHILQAVISAVVDTEKMAVSKAVSLNMMLGAPENEELNKSQCPFSCVQMVGGALDEAL